jgi:hypothetical protein
MSDVVDVPEHTSIRVCSNILYTSSASSGSVTYVYKLVNHRTLYIIHYSTRRFYMLEWHQQCTLSLRSLCGKLANVGRVQLFT